jgi:hypothetical protein
LAANPRARPPIDRIQAYDSFVWRSWMDSTVVGTPLENKYRDGESFLEAFVAIAEPWRDYINPCAEDLCTSVWAGGHIEFLLIDAMKSWDAANGIIHGYFPALVPGESFIFHQDFAHFYTPWIHLTHYRFRRYFALEYEVPQSNSVVFKVRERIPAELLADQYEAHSFDRQEVDAAFDFSASLVSAQKRPNIAAAKVMHFVQMGDMHRACHELEECRSRGLTFDSDLGVVSRRLTELDRRPE